MSRRHDINFDGGILRRGFCPIEEESSAEGRSEHDERRDRVASLEKALRDTRCAAGHRVLNTLKCRKPLDATQFEVIRAAFGVHFPKLINSGSAQAGS